MQNRKIWFLASVCITAIVLVLLVTGSSLLTLALDKKNSIPLGTIITWVGLITFPTAVYWGNKSIRDAKDKFSKIMSYLLKTVMIMAFLWVPIAYLLAGNLSFTFSERLTFQGGQLAMKIFWYYSYAIGIGPIIIQIIQWLNFMFKPKS